MQLQSSPRVVIDEFYFPECMRWREGRLWFSDMFAGRVYRSAGVPGDTAEFVLDIGDHCGGLGWMPNGDLLVVSMNERKLLRYSLDGSRPQVHADLSSFFDHPTNDLLVTETGRAYVTGFGFDADHGAPVESVQLAVVEATGDAYLSGSPMVFPNGIDTWPDREVLVVAETYADRISVVSRQGGRSLEAASLFGEVAEGDGPDGISCDAEGGVWVGCAFGQRAVHLNSRGEIDAEIPVPGRGVYDCLLGGLDGRTLFLAVASTDEAYAAVHRTGSILEVRLG